MKAIVGGTVFTPTHRIQDGVLVMDGSRIHVVGTTGDVAIPPDAERVDARGYSVAPGFVDLHFHGARGHDVMGPGLADLVRALPEYGVTSFMATTLTLPWDETVAALATMADQLGAPVSGAECLGIHLEGPFLSAARPGMARADLLEPLSWPRFDLLQRAAGGSIRMVTFAPEAGEGMSVIPRLIETGVVPVMGHTDATFDQASEAIGAGVRQTTHTYNAMRPLHHREPGALGAAMYFPEVFAQLIGDGLHVHPAAMAILIKVKGPERVVLVSDAAPLAGLPPGEYAWGPQPVYVREDGRCELADGTIAGAHVLIDSGVRRLVVELGLPPEQALTTATLTPAESIGARRKGRLEPGADADVLLLDDELQVTTTFARGELAWQRD